MNHSPTRRAWLPLAAVVALLGGLLLAAGGAVLARPPDAPLAVVPDTRALGINVVPQAIGDAVLPAHLDALRAAGFGWMRLRLDWAAAEAVAGVYDWTLWDATIAAARQAGFVVLLTLDGSPTWARPAADAPNPLAPPADYATFYRFARAVADRYAKEVAAFQIWDEPNIAPHWGSRLIAPTEYLALLREGALAVRAAAPGALVVLAGLAPNREAGGQNLSDLAFLDALYAAGGADWFDVVAAKPYGFGFGADAPPAADQTNFARVALLREVMERHGDRATPIWAVEFGWNALPADWQGAPSLWGAVTETEQAQHAIAAIERARREWPWLGLLAWSTDRPAAPPTDAHWGFALTTPDGQPRPVLDAFRQRAAVPAVAGPGRVAPDDPALEYMGGWRVTPDGADPAQAGDALRLRFDGARLDLHVRRMPYPVVLYATVDGQPANALPRDGQGRAYAMLYAPRFGEDTVTLAAGLTDGPHELELVADGGWRQWPVAGFTVGREGSPSRRGLLLYAGGALALVGAWLLAASRRADWRALQRLSSVAPRLSENVMTGLAAALALGFVLSPWLPLDMLCLAGLAALLVARPALGPPLIAACLPFFLLNKWLAGRAFSVIELGLVLTVAAALARTAWRWLVEGTAPRGRWLPLDAPIALFLGAAILATLVAAEQGVARHELRRVLVEGVLFYVVISRTTRSPWPLLNGWTLGAVAVSLFALYQAWVLQDVAWAEGVGRVRAFYGSANNLALYLDRLLPVLLALAALGAGRRRGAYAAAALPVALACFLTFSRGAWLVGIPAALLFLGLVRGRRALAVALGGLAVIALALLPVLGTERFARLLDTRGGTTFVRLRLWQGTLNMVRDHPIFGVGPDNFLYAYRSRYVLPDAWHEINLSHPHNLILDLWTRLGLLGLAAGLWLLTAAARLGWRLYRRLPEGNGRALTLGLLASLVTTVTHGLIDNSLFLVDLMFVFMMTLALLTILHQTDGAPGDG